VEEVDTVTAQTPFRKGKWITGLAGRISTATTEISSGQDRNFTNHYGINFSPGTFIADRWVVGLAIDFARISSDNVVVDESEIFQVGPFVRFYTSRDPHGSLYFQVLGGYAKFREKIVIAGSNLNINSLINGDGPGFAVGMGYAFLVSETVAFDLGLSYDFIYIDARVTDLTNNVEEKETINRGGTVFSFGFTILIDEFFF
jgi:hypothetical protein